MAEARESFIDGEFEAPAGELEAAVARIAAEVLGVDKIGRTDSFYDFGGTSLQAIRVCARVEKETGYRALPVWIFTHDVLADFVSQLEVEQQHDDK
jgi:hypothetical protein